MRRFQWYAPSILRYLLMVPRRRADIVDRRHRFTASDFLQNASAIPRLQNLFPLLHAHSRRSDTKRRKTSPLAYIPRHIQPGSRVQLRQVLIRTGHPLERRFPRVRRDPVLHRKLKSLTGRRPIGYPEMIDIHFPSPRSALQDNLPSQRQRRNAAVSRRRRPQNVAHHRRLVPRLGCPVHHRRLPEGG